MPSLGEELKKAREERGVTLRNISEATHIGMRFLQAIESDTYDELPGGIFNRSFVRKYAKHVGLDEDQVAARYDQQAAEKGIEAPKTSVSYLEGFEERSSSRFWLPALIFMILCAGAYAAYQYSVTPRDGVATSGSPEVTPTAIATPEPSPSPSSSPSPSANSTPQFDQLRLRIAANTGACWMRVKTDDQPSQEKTLQMGDALDLVASERMIIDLGNLPAVSLELNGKPMKLEAAAGTRIKNVIVTRENYLQYVQ